MKPKLIPGLALVLSCGWFGCSTMKPHAKWPVFYDAKKGPERISISREPQPLGFYTNDIPSWNHDLRIPAAKITAVEAMELGRIGGHQILQVHLSLMDVYYTDTVMILEEMSPQGFLPVYVQDYNRSTRSPSANLVSKNAGKLIILTGMNYAGSGHFYDRYTIIVSPDCDPTVTKL